MDKKKLLKRLSALIFLVFIFNFVATKFYWYSSIWWFDMLMHFLGGFWLALAFIFLFLKKDIIFSDIFKIIIFVLFIGILWEVFEFSLDKTISKNIFNLLDTSSDICFDIAGGLSGIIYSLKRIMIKDENNI